MNFVTLHCPAETRDIGDAGNASKFAFQRPVLERLQVVKGIDTLTRYLGAFQCVAIDFAGRSLRRYLRIYALRQLLGELKPVDDFLPRRIKIDSILELIAEVRQPNGT